METRHVVALAAVTAFVVTFVTIAIVIRNDNIPFLSPGAFPYSAAPTT
jgi:hypothetical protein